MANVELYRRTIERDNTFEHINRRDHSLHEEQPYVPMRRDEAPTATGYNGFFTIKDISPDRRHIRVVVTNGFAYDYNLHSPDNELVSTDSSALVNASYYQIPQQEFDIDPTPLFWHRGFGCVLLHFIAPEFNEFGDQISDPQLLLEVQRIYFPPHPTPTDVYYLIGHVVTYPDDKHPGEYRVEIWQEHWGGNGTPQIWWMTYGCTDTIHR